MWIYGNSNEVNLRKGSFLLENISFLMLPIFINDSTDFTGIGKIWDFAQI